MIIKEAKEKAEETYQHLIDYAEARWNLVALDISDKTASVATNVVASLCLAVLGLFFVLFASMSLAIWLGSLLDSFALGFLIVAVLYGIIGGVVYANRTKWLFLPFMNKFLRMLYRNQDDKLI